MSRPATADDPVVWREKTGNATCLEWLPRTSILALGHPPPKTMAEARSLGERAPVGVKKSLTEAFLQYLVGPWVLSSADYLPEFAELGLVVDPDGRRAALAETDGELRRAAGWGSEGHVRCIRHAPVPFLPFFGRHPLTPCSLASGPMSQHSAPHGCVAPVDGGVAPEVHRHRGDRSSARK